MNNPALSVEALRTEFRIGDAWRPAVDGVSFQLASSETLALVGESGCGKSVTALSVMQLLPPRPRGSPGRCCWTASTCFAAAVELERVRGDRVAMVFQEPMSSLNPVMPIGAQVAESLRLHRGLSRKDSRAAALAVLEEVKIPSAARRYDDYPHQFSGGMRQRVMIALAVACDPAVLLADEPTTALDVTIQAQVLGLLADLKARHGMALLFITHNLGVVAQIADRVAVMYAGQIVEQADVQAVFAAPAHPYTRALFAAIPRMDRPAEALTAIPGRVPPLDAMPAGCRFPPRCPFRARAASGRKCWRKRPRATGRAATSQPACGMTGAWCYVAGIGWGVRR